MTDTSMEIDPAKISGTLTTEGYTGSMTADELAAKIDAASKDAQRGGWSGSTAGLSETHTPTMDEMHLRMQILERRVLRAEALVSHLFAVNHRMVDVEAIVADYEKSLATLADGARALAEGRPNPHVLDANARR